MKTGIKTSEFWFMVGVTALSFGLILLVIFKEGTSGLPMLASVLPFLFGGAGWYQHKRNQIKKD